MALTQVQPGLLAPSSVLLENFSATGPQSDITILSGVNTWIYQDSYYFDMGIITNPAANMVALLLQVTPVDFNQPTLGYDAGSIIQG